MMFNSGLPHAHFVSRPKRGMQVLFFIWVFCIVLILGTFWSQSPLGAFGFSLFFIILALLTAVLAFSEERALEIYEDKLLLRRTKDDQIRDSVAWKDIKDITWPTEYTYRDALNGAMFGALGVLLLSLVLGADQKAPSSDPKTLWIDFNTKRRRLVLDSRYREAVPAIFQVAIKWWTSDIINTLEQHKTVQMGKLQLTHHGICKGNQLVEWSAVANIDYSAHARNVVITFHHPLKKKPQKLRQSLGCKGHVLVNVGRQMHVMSQFELPQIQ